MCILLNYISSNIKLILENIISMSGLIKLIIIVECTYIKPVVNELKIEHLKVKTFQYYSMII